MKGNYKCECNRTVCKNNDAEYYNHSTRKYYCEECADIINIANKEDSKRFFGHDICTIGEFVEPKGETNISIKGIDTKKVRRMNGKIVGVRIHEQIGRNKPCPCGSGYKYKQCCIVR